MVRNSSAQSLLSRKPGSLELTPSLGLRSFRAGIPDPSRDGEGMEQDRGCPIGSLLYVSAADTPPANPTERQQALARRRQ
jgi:hypothetical protein